MSWLNFNDSLNNLKGQISNLANTVWVDNEHTESNTSEHLHGFHTNQQEDVSKLSNDVVKEEDTNWSWDVSDQQKFHSSEPDGISDLKSTIDQLKKEKEDLIGNLELLDSESQQNTEKLIGMKDKLQNDYSQLEERYYKLQDDNAILLKTNKDADKELEELRRKYETHSMETCKKCEDLKREYQELTNQFAALNTSSDVAELKEKIKLQEEQNAKLSREVQKAAQSVKDCEQKSVIEAENCKKIAKILEGYEEQVSALKQELSLLTTQNSNMPSPADFAAVKTKLEDHREQLQKEIDEREAMHKKYVNILTENMKRYVHNSDGFDSMPNCEEQVDPQLSEFSHQVRSILNILLDLKCKNEGFEEELYTVKQEKTNLLSEKNHEIEKLLQNSEILSQEVITKSQTIKDYENECNELIKNNDILISELQMFKNNSGLQTISETNEDNILLLENQLDTANRKVEDLQYVIAQLERASVREENEDVENSLRDEVGRLEEIVKTADSEKEGLSCLLDKVKSDLENAEYQCAELNVNAETLKEEIELQRKEMERLMQENLSLEKSNVEYERSNEDTRTDLNMAREKLLFEEDAHKKLDGQVRHLTEKLQNAKMCETSLKLQYDTVSKELSAVTDAKCTIEASLENAVANLSHCQDNLLILQGENEELKKAVKLVNCNDVDQSKIQAEELERKRLLENLEEAMSRCDVLSSEKNDLVQEIESYRENLSVLEKRIEELQANNHELANVIIAKHQENVAYHSEIQRLAQLLSTEVEKIQRGEEITKKDDEITKLTDQNGFLREKCEILAENLLREQHTVQQMLAQQNVPSEKEQTLTKKLERLQSHLIEVEEHYTQELLRAEEKNEEMRAKISEIEQREKNSSTMYTSVSIRANQHVETLQHQLQLLTNQRDELRKKLTNSEEQCGRQEAALANLQFVLEQFQKDKEKDVQEETERIRRQIEAERRVQEELRSEMRSLQAQLEDSRHGLQAASRLSDQLEQSKQSIVTLKGEVSQLKEKLHKNEEQLQNMSNQTGGKVDKSLIKNLIIGFVLTNNNLNKDQIQILKIIATVLDFNQQDHDKINLNRSQQGWLSSFLHPQASQGISEESLSQAFVKFLENESKPRLVPSLLGNSDETSRSRKNSPTPISARSPSVLSDVVLPTFADFAQNRNSSSILKDVLKDHS